MLKVRRDRNIIVIANDIGRLRLSFGNTRASLPESVDIEIACRGEYAASENLRFIVAQLCSAKVFDVTLTGDEPISHPDFLKLLHELHRAKIATRFTTSAIVPVCNLWDQIRTLVCGFIFTAHTAKDVLMAANYFSLHGVPLYKIRLDYELGDCSRKEFIAYMLAAYARGFRVRLTAREHTTMPYDWWDDEVSRLAAAGKCPEVSVDGELAGVVSKATRRIASVRCHAHGMYVNAVDMSFGRSAQTQLQPFTLTWREMYTQLPD